MKNNAFILIITIICAALVTAALILTRGILRTVLCIAAGCAWTVLFIRHTTLRYSISDDEISIKIGIIIRSRITIKRSAVLSVSQLYFGRHFICAVVRTAGKTAVLFCELPAIYLN